MTKHKRSDARAELSKIELLPRDEAARRTDDLLRNMLNTPPEPFTPKARAKPKKRAK